MFFFKNGYLFLKQELSFDLRAFTTYIIARNKLEQDDIQGGKIKGWARVLLIIVPYLIIVGLFQYVGAYVAGKEISPEFVPESTDQHLITSFFGLLGSLLVIYLFVELVDD